jgi:transcription elongation GreA/GreB family factor
MSRAFVKETDGDSADDLPELPLSPHPNYVTLRGLELLRQRLAQARQRAAAAGDSDPAKQTRAQADREIRWITARIASAIPVDPAKQPRDVVAFGATITVADGSGRQLRYRIVGEDEAEPDRGWVSWVSPLARALTGARAGEVVTWQRPTGDMELEVLEIHYDEDSRAQ